MRLLVSVETEGNRRVVENSIAPVAIAFHCNA
jgi:hypothetical protein